MGFYYDDQIKNKDYTIRLYGGGPNYDESPGSELAVALFNEDFEFEVANTWSDFDGGNAIEGLFNTVKPYAAYTGEIIEQLNKLDLSGGTTKPSKLLNAGIGWVRNNGSTINDYLNKSLVVQGTRFIYFSGTNINMGNMMMKYIVMYDPVKNETVQDQLSKLLPYVIGDFHDMSGQLGRLGEMIGWQDPPGGFEASYMNVDNQLKGTLKLKFGDLYEIDNLVIKTMHVVGSRVKVKPKSGSISTPLYADVTLTFQLGGYITKNKLKQFIKMKG